MQTRDGFMIREVAGQSVVVPLGQRVVEFNGIMTLSESGAMLWRMLQKGATDEELVNTILNEYDIDEETAREDVRTFIQEMSERNLLSY